MFYEEFNLTKFYQFLRFVVRVPQQENFRNPSKQRGFGFFFFKFPKVLPKLSLQEM